MDRLILLMMLPPILGLILFAAVQALRRPSLLIALSVYTVSLDHMGRITEGSLFTVNVVLKIALLGVMLVWMTNTGKRLVLPRLLLWYLPFLIFSGLSAFYSADFPAAVFYFSRQVLVWLFAVLVANFVQKRGDVALVLGTMVLTALVVSILAHMQTLNMLTMGTVEAFQKQGPEASTVRAMSTFWDSNRMGQYLAVLSVFLMALLRQPGLARFYKLAILGILFLSFGAILLSFSRSAWILLALSSLLFLRYREMRPVVLTFAVLALLALGYMTFFTPYGASILHRFQTLGTLAGDFSGRFRTFIALSGLEIWASGMRWLWGGGFYSFASLVSDHWHPLMSHDMIYHSGTRMSHTLYITVIAEGGLIGAALFVLFLRAVFRELERVMRLEPDGLMRTMLIAVWVLLFAKLVDWLFNPSYSDNQFWLLLGLLGAAGWILEREKQPLPGAP